MSKKQAPLTPQAKVRCARRHLASAEKLLAGEPEVVDPVGQYLWRQVGLRLPALAEMLADVEKRLSEEKGSE